MGRFDDAAVAIEQFVSRGADRFVGVDHQDAAAGQERAEFDRGGSRLACVGAIFWPTFWITCLMSRALRRMCCSRATTSGSWPMYAP